MNAADLTRHVINAINRASAGFPPAIKNTCTCRDQKPHSHYALPMTVPIAHSCEVSIGGIQVR